MGSLVPLRQRHLKKKRLSVVFDGREVFSRDVESFTCEESIEGIFTAEAVFAAVKADQLGG